MSIRSCCSYPFLPLLSGHHILKKKSRITVTPLAYHWLSRAPARLPLYHASRRPSFLSSSCLHRGGVLPHDRTAAVCSQCEAAPPDYCCRLHRGHHVRPIAGGRTVARLLPSSSTATAQRGSRCAMLRPPSCYVLLKAYVSSVSNVSELCYKCFRWMLQSRSGCCICYNGCTRMLQRSITNVSSVFSGRMLQMCLSGYCICFTHTLHVFYLDVAYVYNDF
jgi:hypothetical protein